MPGLDKDQYSVLWVEYRDKGRLETEFSGTEHELHDRQASPAVLRLADCPRIDAWQTV
ncbi:hypothetical protein [Klebsiella pneumoniae]|uniref:hypothetical protein n=1 Tax=Klebsiella pneumoniae TaxID=573 RepID=UPI0022B6E276|nr:hypothetical protein [Klebsiella pneumoniae]